MSHPLHMFRNMRFKQKLILSYLIVSLIPIALLGTYSYNQSKLFLRKQAVQGLQDTVGTMARGMNEKTVQYERTVDSVVMNTGLQRIFGTQYKSLTLLSEDLRKYVDPYFSMIKSLNKDMLQLTVYMPDTMPEYGDSILSLNRLKGNSLWYNTAMQQKQTGWYHNNDELVVYRQFPTILYNNMEGILYLKLNKELFLSRFRRSLRLIRLVTDFLFPMGSTMSSISITVTLPYFNNKSYSCQHSLRIQPISRAFDIL